MMTMTLVRLQDPPVIEVHTRVQRWSLHGDAAVRWLTSLLEPPQSDPSTGPPDPEWRSGVDADVLAVLDHLNLSSWVSVVNTELAVRELANRLGPGCELAPWASDRWDTGMCADWCLIEAATWRSYVARDQAPKPLRERNRYNGRVEWDAAAVRHWRERERAGQGARTDLSGKR